jgi:hypothetical protein
MSKIRSLILALALAAGLAPAFAQAPPAVPALPDTTRQTNYSITASTCVCSVGFQIYGDSTDYQNWVQVWLNGVQVAYNDASKGWTITSPSGSLSTIPRPITDGVLTFNSAQTGTVQIVGARRPRRTSQFQENRGVAARDLNQLNTDIIAQNREEWDFRSRTVQAVPGEVLAPLPSASLRAGGYMGFDGLGNPTVLPGTGSSPNAIGNGQLFGNFSGGSAPPSGATPSSIWDAFCSTSIGNFWVRMSSGWGCVSLGYANPAWWGADPTGSADSASAINSAIATGLPVRVPPGTFKVGSKVTKSFTNNTDCFSFNGAGKGITILRWPNATGGLLVDGTGFGVYNCFKIANLTLQTAQNGGGDAIKLLNGGISVIAPSSIIENVSIQGADTNSTGLNYWNNGIYTHFWSGISVSHVDISGDVIHNFNVQGGTAINIEGDLATTNYVQSIKVSDSWLSGKFNVILGAYWQGLLFHHVNMGGDTNILAGTAGGILVQLTFTDSIFFAQTTTAFFNVAITGFQFIGNNTFSTTASGTQLYLGNTFLSTITGNVITGPGSPMAGIRIDGSTNTVTGNTFNGFATGVFLSGTAVANTVGLNAYFNTTTKILNSGTGNSVGTAAAGNMTGVVP